MNDPFVADASVGVAWATPSQGDRETDRLIGDVAAGSALIVPAIWSIEVANALLMLHRRKKMDGGQRRRAVEMLEALEREVDSFGMALAFGPVSDLADEYALTIYDATYLELAIRRSLPLASRDAALNKAAKKCGVKTLL